MVRLKSLESRAWALVGDAAQTTRTIGTARHVYDDRETDELHTSSGGEFTFSPDRQAFCAVACYVQIGNAAQAVSEAETALERYGAGPDEDRWDPSEYGACVDLATGRLLQQDLDGVQEALTAVFTLPSDRRSARITRRLHRLSERLAEPPYSTMRTARELREQIRDFSAESIVCDPGR